MQLFLRLATNEHWELLQDLNGGLDPQVYQTYTRLLVLNDISEEFVFNSEE